MSASDWIALGLTAVAAGALVVSVTMMAVSLAPYVDLAASVILALAAIWGAFVAWRGLKAWRDQLRVRTAYDLSRRLLVATYRVRDEIARVRSPLMTGGELAAAAKEAGLDPASGKAATDAAIAAVRDLRWRHPGRELSTLAADELEAEVLWKKEPGEVFAPLHQHITQLRTATMEYYALSDDDMPRAATDPSRLVELRSVMHGSGRSGDTFAEKIQSSIDGIERYLRPHLRL